MNEEQKRYVREGLENEEQLAAFDLLDKYKTDLPKAKSKRVKLVACELLENIKATIARIDNWTAKNETKATVRNFIHDFLYDEKTGLPSPEFDETDIDALTEAFFKHVLTQYPSAEENVYNGG